MAQRCCSGLRLLGNSNFVHREFINCGSQLRSTRSQSIRTVRWNSGGGTGSGGGSSGSGKSPVGGGGFFQNFVKNFQKVVKGDEMQESLKGFHEEREKMNQSYVVQQAKLKLKELAEKVGSAGTTGTEKTSQGWTIVKKTSSKVTNYGLHDCVRYAYANPLPILMFGKVTMKCICTDTENSALMTHRYTVVSTHACFGFGTILILVILDGSLWCW